MWESDYPDRQFFNLTYGRNIGSHQLFLRSNLMLTQNQLGAQFLAEFYPKFDEVSYGYGLVAFSNFDLFPRVKLDAEYFRIFGTWETSLGLRYTRTIENNIFGFTGIVGKYHGNWFTYFRPIFSFVDGDFAEGFLLASRRYFATKDNFAEALVYYGNDTGELADLSTLNLGLKYFLVRGSYQHAIKKNIVLAVGIDYSGYFNAAADRYIKVYSADFSISKRF